MTARMTSLSSRLDRWFFTVMGLLIAATVFVGFSASFYLRGVTPLPLAPLLVVHGIVFTTFVLLFIVQSFFIATDRIKIQAARLVRGGAGAPDGLVGGAGGDPSVAPRPGAHPWARSPQLLRGAYGRYHDVLPAAGRRDLVPRLR